MTEQLPAGASSGALQRLLGETTLAFVLLALAEGALLSWPLLRQVRGLEQELRESVRTDALTGCLNFRAFTEDCGKLFARSRRYHSSVAVLVVDADGFQQVNARHGRAGGDLVIGALAGMLLRNLREMDTIGRMDGVRFAVLLPESGLLAAMLVAQRLRKAIASSRIAAAAQEQALVSITISVGVATLREGDLTLFEAIARAEEAVALAKEKGSDRVECESKVLVPA